MKFFLSPIHSTYDLDITETGSSVNVKFSEKTETAVLQSGIVWVVGSILITSGLVCLQLIFGKFLTITLYCFFSLLLLVAYFLCLLRHSKSVYFHKRGISLFAGKKEKRFINKADIASIEIIYLFENSDFLYGVVKVSLKPPKNKTFKSSINLFKENRVKTEQLKCMLEKMYGSIIETSFHHQKTYGE